MKTIATGEIRTLIITPTHNLIESTTYKPHTTITNTKWITKKGGITP